MLVLTYYPLLLREDKGTVRLSINGQSIEAKPTETILEAAERAGIEIPTLCCHEALLRRESCRLCVVEIMGRRRLTASCAYPVEEGIEIQTASPRVRRARRANIALLLLHYPSVPKVKELADQIGVNEAILSRFRPDREMAFTAANQQPGGESAEVEPRLSPEVVKFLKEMERWFRQT